MDSKSRLRCRISFRKARLAAKKSLTQAQRLERELVVQSYFLSVSEATTLNPADDTASAPIHHFSRPIQKPQTSSLSEKDRQTVGASNRATDALRQMHASLQAELERSEYANQTMRESNVAFSQLHDSYSSLEIMLSSSKDLLGTLMRSQKSDTWYLTTTFYMLLVVGAWLVFRRLLYGPMWWLVWLPLRMVFGVGTNVGKVALQGRGGAGKSEMATVLGTDGKLPVEGLPKENLPTAQVGQEIMGEPSSGNPDSMVEKVGKVVDTVKEADELGSILDFGGVVEDTAEVRPGTDQERQRDEL